MERQDKRASDELREIKITADYTKYAEGSVLIEAGDTRVLCNASVENRVPDFLRDSGKGWVTAEYAMLPRATGTRSRRDISSLKLAPRSAEISRLIGRALRSITDLTKLNGLTITVDCDVIQADGGTRTASITGGYVALWLACKRLIDRGTISEMPLTGQVAAVSAGIVDNEVMLDLCYTEDSRAEADFNLVMAEDGRIVEIQGTGEQRPFSETELNTLIKTAEKGISFLLAQQRKYMK